MSKLKNKRNVPVERRRYVDFKKRVFEDYVPTDKHIAGFKMDAFTHEPEHTGFGYVIVYYIDSQAFSSEGQPITFDDTIKRKDSGFVDVEPTEYYKDDHRQIRMNGSYFHGFHYFKSEEDALLIGKNRFSIYAWHVKQISVYHCNARGYMRGVPCYSTTKMYVHK